MMREDQRGEDLRRHAKEFIDILGVPANSIDMLMDDRRFKVRINGVWTGRDGEGGINTPEDLKEELERFNPIMSRVTLMGNPRWMRAMTDLQEKEHSSIVLEFAKEEDAQAMIAAKYVAMFANFCKVVHHADRPPVLQCSRCWAIGHHVSRCKHAARCRLCAGEHSEKDHVETEAHQMAVEGIEEDENSSQKKKQEKRCVNCGGDHTATERSCPERRRFQMIAREKDRMDVGGGTLRKKRIIKKKVVEIEVTKDTGGPGDENAPTNERTEANKGGKDGNAGQPTSNNNKTADTGRNTNRLALENLLNNHDSERWDEMEVEGIEDTRGHTAGNVQSS